MDNDIVDMPDGNLVEASCDKEELEVDDCLEEEGEEINDNTFPDCDMLDDVKEGGRVHQDTDAAEGQK